MSTAAIAVRRLLVGAIAISLLGAGARTGGGNATETRSTPVTLTSVSSGPGVVATDLAARMTAGTRTSGSNCAHVPTAGNPRETITICSSLDTSEFPRWARSTGKVKITKNATSATGCRLTTWVDLADQSGHSWSSKRESIDCSWALNLRNSWRIDPGQTVTTRAAVRARGHACVDLYFNKSKQSGWQRCAPPTRWLPLISPGAVEAPETPKPETQAPPRPPTASTGFGARAGAAPAGGN